MKKIPVHSLQIQGIYLDNLILNQLPVSIYLKNSIRLKGFLMHQTEQAVFLKHKNINIAEIQMIYKNSISTISAENIIEQYKI